MPVDQEVLRLGMPQSGSASSTPAAQPGSVPPSLVCLPTDEVTGLGNIGNLMCVFRL